MRVFRRQPPTLRFAGDAAAADWLVRADVPWQQLVSFGPGGFAAHGRLRHIPDPTRPGQESADVDLPEDRPSDLDRATRALAVLGAFTATPDRCWFGVWDGFGAERFPARPAWFGVPERRYALLEGRLRDVDGWDGLLGTGWPPAFVWPDDRSWIFANDVDPHWAGIGASALALAALIADPALDVVPADPTAPQPAYH